MTPELVSGDVDIQLPAIMANHSQIHTDFVGFLSFNDLRTPVLAEQSVPETAFAKPETWRNALAGGVKNKGVSTVGFCHWECQPKGHVPGLFLEFWAKR